MRTSFSDSDPPDRHLKESGLMHTSCSHSHHQAYTRAASQQVAKTDPVNAPRPHSSQTSTFLTVRSKKRSGA
eukprot:4286280-Prymnesium_polylepis.1